MIHCNEHLKVKMSRLRGTLCDSLGHIAVSMPRFCLFVFSSVLVFLAILLNFVLFPGGGSVTKAEGRGKGKGSS